MSVNLNLIDTVEQFGVPEEQEQRERFKIETKDQAAWALRKMSRSRREQDENIQTAAGGDRADHFLAVTRKTGSWSGAFPSSRVFCMSISCSSERMTRN